MPLACIAVRLAGAAAGLASAHAAGIHRGLQGPLPARYQHRPLASIVARRSCRRRGHEACGWHALWLSGAASGAASAHASCIHRCGCRRATGARRLHPLFRAGPAIFKASTFAACIQGGMPQLVRKKVLQAWCAWSAGWGRSTSTIEGYRIDSSARSKPLRPRVARTGSRGSCLSQHRRRSKPRGA